MLRIGIVGAGFMGQTHAAGWANTPAKITGITSLDTSRAAALASQYQAQVYNSLDTLIDAVDVVDICTPTHLHHEMVLKAARAGKHIICEKPLARTLEQAQEMIGACERAAVKLLVAHVVRFFPAYASAKAIVERGEIGRVAVIRLTRASFQPSSGDPNWFLDYEKSGGMMLDLMIHDFDYARWVAGEVVSVYAKNAKRPNFNQPGDYALAILRHKNDALSHIEGGWAYPPPLFRTALEIAGDAGLIEQPVDSTAPLTINLQSSDAQSGPDIAVPASPLAEDPYTTEIKHFYRVLTQDGFLPRVTPQDARAALQIALAAIESVKTNQPVRIEELP